jgi:hypothetical protein
MRPRLLAMAGLFLWVCVFASGASAQRQLQLYATILDDKGAPAASVTPEDVKVQENGADLKIVKVEPIEWTTKVQILLDNGTGVGANNLNLLRNGLKGLLEALPPGVETTIVTTAPQPRFLVRATTDRQQLLQGIDKLAPDSGVGRFVESLGEALQRNERDKTDFFGIIVTLGTTSGDNRVLDRDINQIFERAQKKPTTVHVVMVSTSPGAAASGGAVQTEVGMQIAKMTNGRYDSIAAPSRIATLLPEIGAQVAKSSQGANKQFRITAERAGGNSNEPSKISMGARNGLAVTSVTIGAQK